MGKLPSPQSWATRTAVSCALTKSTPPPVSATLPVVGSRNYSISEKHETSPSSDHHHYEEIMELKRQLVHMNQDLHLTKSRCRRQELELLAKATSDHKIIILQTDQISRS